MRQPFRVIVLNFTGIIGKIHRNRHRRDAEDARGSLGSRSRGVRRGRDTILIVIL